MSLKYLAGAATTEGGTTRTTLGDLTIPAGAVQILGAWAYVGVIDTTIEQASGIFDLESSDLAMQPCQMPLHNGGAVTSGARGHDPKIFPLNKKCAGGEKITAYLTLDAAMTGNPKARWGLVVEVPDR